MGLFGRETALLVIDAQKGINEHGHWGGNCGHSNNPDAEHRIAQLLDAWRERKLPVYFTLHNSHEAASPLKLSLESSRPIKGLEARPGERVVKDLNSDFTGTDLELHLRRDRVSRLLVAGFFTNMCVETTVRAADNVGYETHLARDACAAGNRLAPDGSSFDADLVHAMSVATCTASFFTALTGAQAIGLAHASNADLHRMQGNELYRRNAMLDLAEAA